MTTKAKTPTTNHAQTARDLQAFGDLDALIYGYPERPGTRRNPVTASRLG